MTAVQLKRMLKRSKLSARKAAGLLDVSSRTLYRFTAGRQPVPRSIEYSIKWIARQRRLKARRRNAGDSRKL